MFKYTYGYSSVAVFFIIQILIQRVYLTLGVFMISSASRAYCDISAAEIKPKIDIDVFIFSNNITLFIRIFLF